MSRSDRSRPVRSGGAAPVLIIGAGAAGLRTAIELASAGLECLVVGKRRHGDAHTRWAAGGINAVLGTRDPDDRWDIHAADTIREGAYLCQPRAVELLARESPERVLELASWGCGFDRTEDGRLDQRYFGAQSFRRTCFVGDTTGEAILATLVERAADLGIPFRQNVFITGITVHRRAVSGALGVDLDSGAPLHIPAPTIVLAAGGSTSIYDRSTSRDDENTGDAAGLAYDVGAELRDMELVQFHPTGMLGPPGTRGHLVTEAVRGEGGRLLNARGERFMERHAPDQMELAARDIVARAIDREVREGRGTPAGGVLLDLSHEDPALIRDRLPGILETYRGQGIDITSEPVEVSPTAHYPMGGIRVDPETGETNVRGLYAVGEASSGVHGANRLGGNSLAETLVFGQRVGAHIGRRLRRRSPPPLKPPDPDTWAAHASRLESLGRARGEHDPEELLGRLRHLMWDRAGIVRSGDGVREGLAELDALAGHAHRLDVVGSRAGARAIAFALTLPFALLAAEAILRSALLREESRGAHFREDAPDAREEWHRSIVCSRGERRRMTLRTEPVPPIPPTVQRALDEHHALDYHHLE